MTANSARRPPEVHPVLGYPIWWNAHGHKMRVESADDNDVVLTSSAAEVKISRSTADVWFVDWKVVQFVPTGEGVNGRTGFSRGDLTAAFGLSDEVGEFGGWMIDRFGGDTANQKSFIRYEDFLNIPGPGTGNDGDPNVSILLSEEITAAVERLLE
jgi:hypothetical protein